MSVPLTREQLANRQFLEMRCKVLELAAMLDRLDRADGAELTRDPRFVKLRRSIELLLGPGPGRAESVQMVFSREYDPKWRKS